MLSQLPRSMVACRTLTCGRRRRHGRAWYRARPKQIRTGATGAWEAAGFHPQEATAGDKSETKSVLVGRSDAVASDSARSSFSEAPHVWRQVARVIRRPPASLQACNFRNLGVGQRIARMHWQALHTQFDAQSSFHCVEKLGFRGCQVAGERQD